MLEAAEDSDVRIDAVGLNQEITSESPLNQIAVAPTATVTSTSDLDKLKEVFESEAERPGQAAGRDVRPASAPTSTRAPSPSP